MVALLTLLTGCVTVPFNFSTTTVPKGTYRAYYGVEPAETELATLDLGSAPGAIIDDMHFVSGKNYSLVKLIAGMHSIKWVESNGISDLEAPTGHAAYYEKSKINFEPGHTYSFFRIWAKRTGGDYELYTWIEDMTAGKLCMGRRSHERSCSTRRDSSGCSCRLICLAEI
jgi:hypothetical protein